MPRTLLRLGIIALTVFLPGCLVVTCGPWSTCGGSTHALRSTC